MEAINRYRRAKNLKTTTSKQNGGGIMGKFKPGQSGNLGGRPKGVPNKITTDLKEAYLEVFEMKGGVRGLFAWAEENPDLFYSHISKLLPKGLEIKSENDLTFNIISAIPEPLPLEQSDIEPPKLPGPDDK